MVRSSPRLVVATSMISLFSIITPVSARVNTPLRPRRHAAAIQERSLNDVDVDFVSGEKLSLEVRELLNERGLLGDTLNLVGNTLNDVVAVVGDTVNGVTSVVGNVVSDAVGGGQQTATTTSNPPANSTPATISTQTNGNGNPGNGNGSTTTTNGSGNPTTSNAQNNNPSGTTSVPSQQTSKVGSGTTGANGSTVVTGTGSLTRSPGASTTDPADTIFAQNAIANGNGSTRKSTMVQTKTYISTLSDGSVSTSYDVTTTTVDVPGDSNETGNGNPGKGPNSALIGIVIAIFLLLLLVGVGIFIWRRRKRQAILLTRSRPASASSFGSVSDEWAHHARDSTMIGLGGSAASMGSGGSAVPEMTERRKSGINPGNSSAYGRQARLSASGPLHSPSEASSSPRGSLGTSNIHFPPNQYPVLVNLSDYPAPGTYTAFANPPESSSEDHSLQQARSGDHYEASTETFDDHSASSALAGVSFASPITPTAERSFHTSFREERRTMSPTQRLSEYEYMQTPRASVDNPFSDRAQIQRPSIDSGASIAINYARPPAPSPLTSTFGPTGEPQPSSPFITGTGRDAESMRESYLTHKESFTTAKSNKTNSTITLSPAPTRLARGDSVSAVSTTSTDDFYSATSHGSPSISHEHSTGNGQTSSSGHYITAPENPFADPSPQTSSGDSRYSTASQASAVSAASQSVSFHPQVVQHRGTSARAEMVAAMSSRSPRRTSLAVRPMTGQSSSGQSIVSSEADPEAARCISPNEDELFYRPLNIRNDRDERPSEDTTVPEDYQRTISAAKARKILGEDV